MTIWRLGCGLLRLACLGLVWLALAAGHTTRAEQASDRPAAPPVTRWALPSAYPVDNPHTQNLLAFAEAVASSTNGTLDIKVEPNGTALAAPEIKPAVEDGKVQAGEVLLSIYENESPLFGLDVLPDLATSFEEARALYAASRAGIERKLAQQGLVLLFAVPWGPQGLFVDRPIGGIDDLKDLKWRAYNVGTARIGELVGADAVTIEAAKLPKALESGAIDAMMTSAATGVESGVGRALPHFYDVRAWLPKNVTIANRQAYDALSAAQRAALLQAAAQAEARGWKLWQEKTDGYLKQLAAQGVTVSPRNQAFDDALLRQAGEDLLVLWLEKAGDEGADILGAYEKN